MAVPSLRPVLPEQIVNDFGGKAEPTQEGVRALTAAIAQASAKAAQTSLELWTALFRKTCGQDWPRPKARLDRLARHYGVDHDLARPEIVLFASQSWYVLLVKLLLGHVVAAARGRKSPLAGNDPGRTVHVRTLIESIESGELFAGLGITDPWCGEPFGWTVSAWSPALEWAIIRANAGIIRYDPMVIVAHAADGGDLLKPLYESLFPRAVRHALGEYYTPNWLAEHVLDQVGYCGQADARLLDPTCGSGTFLLAALRRWRQGSRHRHEGINSQPRAPCPAALIVGFDLHPLAVASARANYLLAIADLLGPEAPIDVPVLARDAILDQRPDEAAFDFVVGNPPWIAWDNLPGDYREATKPHWERYGLFSLSGNEARHGGGKKDLSMLVLYAAADRYLAPSGRLGMVITQTLFQTKGAGDGFRRFRIGVDGPPLRVLRVDDLVDLRPFGDAANWTSIVVLQKGEPTIYPVRYVKWSAGEAPPPPPAARARMVEGPRVNDSFSRCELLAQPIDPECPTTPWIVRPQESEVDLSRLVGRADYTAHLGANSGGANAVYWLELQDRGANGVLVRNLVGKAKRGVEPVEAEIEPDLLYPLVRWIDVDRWSARPSAHLLLAQDPQTRTGFDEERFRRDYPRTFDYLKRFEPLLTSRAAYRRYQDRQPFYSMYNVGPYTLAATKVIWRRMDRKIRAAVVERWDDPLLGLRPIIPQETCVLIACGSGDEAHYLCALLNSSLVHDLVASHSVAGGKGFGTPSILDYLPLRKFDPADLRHVELAALSQRLHGLARKQVPEAPEVAEIDRLAGMVFDT
ncbi:MAG: N-6 DNA methylase [Thermoguttaceae bacterium]